MQCGTAASGRTFGTAAPEVRSQASQDARGGSGHSSARPAGVSGAEDSTDDPRNSASGARSRGLYSGARQSQRAVESDSVAADSLPTADESDLDAMFAGVPSASGDACTPQGSPEHGESAPASSVDDPGSLRESLFAGDDQHDDSDVRPVDLSDTHTNLDSPTLSAALDDVLPQDDVLPTNPIDAGPQAISSQGPRRVPRTARHNNAEKSHGNTTHAVSVPRYIAVPVAAPTAIPQHGFGAPASEIRADKPALQPNLPDPEDTGANISTVDSIVDADGKNDPDAPEPDRVAAESSDPETASNSDSETSPSPLQRRRARAMQRFRRFAQAATAELLARQEPIPQKLPRQVRRCAAELEALKSDQREEIIRLLRTVAGTRSPCALETLRDYAFRRQSDIRASCATGFGEVDHVCSSVALLKMLEDKSTDVVDAAIRSVLNLKHSETVRPLIALGTADVRCRSLIRDVLQEMDDEECAELSEPVEAEVRNDEFPEHSAFALQLLAMIRGSELLKTCAALTKHKSSQMRTAAVEALSQMGENRAVRFLNSRMRDRSADVRTAAACGLANVNSPRSATLLIEALKDPAVSVRRASAKTLAGMEGEEIAAAVSKALNTETDPAVVESLLETVGRAGTDDALVTLQKYLDSDDRELRHRAISTLRRLKNRKGAAMLIPFLSDTDNDTRRLAVEAVGALGEPSVAPALRDIVSKDRQEPVRAAAARALGELKDKKAQTVLEEALHDGRTVRCQAIVALGLIGDKCAVPALLAQLRDQAPEIRYHACNALGEIGELSGPEPLQDLLDDKEAMVSRAAEAALTRLGYTYKQAKWKRRITKMLTGLIPGTVAGALPGGVAVLILFATAAIGSGIFFVVNGFDLSAAPDFPVSDVNSIAVSLDGSQVSIGRKFRVLEVWDLKSGEQMAQFQSESGADSVFYVRNGNPLVLAGTSSFEIDTAAAAARGKEALSSASLKNVSTFRVAVTPDGEKAILCASSGMASLVDLTNGSQLKKFRIPEFGGDSALTISPDASLAFSGTASGILQVISLKEGRVLGALNISELIEVPGSAITALAMDHTGSLIAIGTGNGRVAVVNFNDGEVMGTPYNSAGSVIRAIAFVGATRKLHVVTSGKELAVCSGDFSSSTPLKSRLDEAPEQISFSADGNVAAVSYSESDRFCVVDMAQDRILVQYPEANE